MHLNKSNEDKNKKSQKRGQDKSCDVVLKIPYVTRSTQKHSRLDINNNFIEESICVYNRILFD